MNRMRGTVDKIWHNQRADGSEYWVLSIDGQRYSTWVKSMAANIRQGDVVEFVFSDSGRYKNLTALKRTGALSFAATQKPGVDTKLLRKVRMSCLRTAAELLNGTTLLPEQRLTLATDMAQKIEKYVLRPPDNSSKTADSEKNQRDTISRKEGKRER